MTPCLFASDLHGRVDRYQKLVRSVAAARPVAVFLGGDLLPSSFRSTMSAAGDFVRHYVAGELQRLREKLGAHFPRIFAILGNDDPRAAEPAMQEVEALGLIEYVHARSVVLASHRVYGYACVPPTPFRLKDWERYDVSRHVDPGCVSPEEGIRSSPISERERRWSTIKADLDHLTGDAPVDRAVFLFHTPPYQTALDQGDLGRVSVDSIPLDVHLGSVAVRRFIEARQPLVTLHGHIHESARLSRTWRDRIGRTHLFSAAHDGPELALVCFDLDDPESAERTLI